MIPVEQTKTGFPDGNCFAACVASILEMPLDSVPHFLGDGWFDQWLDWLKQFNLTLINLVVSPDWQPKGYTILAADSPRGEWLHAVVCLNGEIVWDPHPLREMGVKRWKEWTVFTVLDPSKPYGVNYASNSTQN
jgi:hypothetical protein